MPVLPAELTPWILPWIDQPDGVEIYALYGLVFVTITAAIRAAAFMEALSPGVQRVIPAAAAILAGGYFISRISFTPPMSSLTETPAAAVMLQTIVLLASLTVIIALLHRLDRFSPSCATGALALLLFPACFIATGPISPIDSSYIFAPALRLLGSAPLSDIYFQYDLFPSLLAYLWLKAGFDPYAFQRVGQAGFYLGIICCYLLATRLFQQRLLSLLLAAALVLVRLYATPFDTSACFQVTPFRLDLWLPLAVLTATYGVRHWSTPLLCAFLLLLHRNFGIIYSIAWLQLRAMLFLIEWRDSSGSKPLPERLISFGKELVFPCTLMFTALTAGHLFFYNKHFGDYAGYYRKIGIGFLRISSESFYWYIPPLFCVTTILLIRLRHRLPPNNLATGFMLIFCAIGNSIYFFGRSHENNILNIAVVLLFLLFFMLDLAGRSFREQSDRTGIVPFLSRHGTATTAALILLTVIVSYSGTISAKLRTQTDNAAQGRFLYPSGLDLNRLHERLAAVRTITGNSSRVFFADLADFPSYYFGGYAPVGYCNPFQSWLFIRDLTGFLQGLLDDGYYVVCSRDMIFLPANLRYRYRTDLDDAIIVSSRGFSGRPL